MWEVSLWLDGGWDEVDMKSLWLRAARDGCLCPHYAPWALPSTACRAAANPAAAASSLPETLLSKLAKGGRMVIPVGPQWEYQVRPGAETSSVNSAAWGKSGGRLCKIGTLNLGP